MMLPPSGRSEPLTARSKVDLPAALLHCDAVVQCSPEIDPEVLKAVAKSKLPFLPYTDDMVNACADFYKTL